MAKQAFLIQHFGKSGSAVRERADHVMQTIIVPACERTGYTCARADQFPVETIVEPIISALASSPLTVVDLGSPPWSENVLMEVGFRMANGKPTVYLADTEFALNLLPLHLRNNRILTIQDDPSIVDHLVEYINEQSTVTTGWSSQYPTFDVRVPMRCPDHSAFTSANESAAHFYGYDTVAELLSVSVDNADQRLKQYMGARQARHFDEEQKYLFGVALTGGEAISSIPAWFTRHPRADFNNKPFWPALLSRRFSPHEDQSLVMRVAFVNLSKWIGPGQPGSSDVVKLPHHLRPRAFKHDVFLTYNSKDFERVKTIAELLKYCGMKVWFDNDSLEGDGGLYEELKNSMYESRMICIVIGRNGLGPWQEDVELRGAISDVVRNQRPCIVLLLDDVDDSNDDWLNMVPTAYRDFFANQLYGKVPSKADMLPFERNGNFVRRILGLFARTFKEADQELT